MATYRTTLTTATDSQVVFDYVAQFSSAVEWDPGVVASRALDSGPFALGSAFELTVRTLGRDVIYRYEVTALDEPRSVVLRGEAGSFATTDSITVETRGGVTCLTYEAVLEVKGPARIFAPVLPIVFNRICDRAASGLQREIDGLATRPAPDDSHLDAGEPGSRPA